MSESTNLFASMICLNFSGRVYAPAELLAEVPLANGYTLDVIAASNTLFNAKDPQSLRYNGKLYFRTNKSLIDAGVRIQAVVEAPTGFAQPAGVAQPARVEAPAAVIEQARVEAPAAKVEERARVEEPIRVKAPPRVTNRGALQKSSKSSQISQPEKKIKKRYRWPQEETDYAFDLARQFIVTNGYAPVGINDYRPLNQHLYQWFRGTSVWGQIKYHKRQDRLVMFHLARWEKNKLRFEKMAEAMLGKGWRKIKLELESGNKGDRKPGIPPVPKKRDGDDDDESGGVGGGFGAGAGAIAC